MRDGSLQLFSLFIICEERSAQAVFQFRGERRERKDIVKDKPFKFWLYAIWILQGEVTFRRFQDLLRQLFDLPVADYTVDILKKNVASAPKEGIKIAQEKRGISLWDTRAQKRRLTNVPPI